MANKKQIIQYDTLTKEELIYELKTSQALNEQLRNEIDHIMETVRLCNSNRGENHGTINNNFVGDDYFNNKT